MKHKLTDYLNEREIEYGQIDSIESVWRFDNTPFCVIAYRVNPHYRDSDCIRYCVVDSSTQQVLSTFRYTRDSAITDLKRVLAENGVK